MKKAKIYENKITIPTYPEPAAEEMPMFAENRVHQRSSGRPYPNKVFMAVYRTHKEDKGYKLVTLENEYVKIEILPEIGGRIYSAYDKTTGYDYFYKQHVIKPALIGVLGSWISGGVEFNWPFHLPATVFSTGLQWILTVIYPGTRIRNRQLLILHVLLIMISSAAGMNDADELYLAGVHVDQYRDPHTNPDSFWKEALKCKINHIPSLIAMAKYELSRYSLNSAEDYVKRAIEAITIYNERVQSGDVYYTYGSILEARGETYKAYDYYYKAYWAADSVAKAMTRIAL